MSGNEKSEKFVELAERRTREAIKKIRLIGNLSNKNNYSYGPEQVDQIFKALQRELDESRQKFKERAKASDVFKLK